MKKKRRKWANRSLHFSSVKDVPKWELNKYVAAMYCIFVSVCSYMYKTNYYQSYNIIQDFI